MWCSALAFWKKSGTHLKMNDESSADKELQTLTLDSNPTKTRGVSHRSLAIYIKKYLKAKEELWEFEYFTMQNYNLKKKSSERNQNPSRYYNSITNLKFQHKPEYHLSKILI